MERDLSRDFLKKIEKIFVRPLHPQPLLLAVLLNNQQLNSFVIEQVQHKLVALQLCVKVLEFRVLFALAVCVGIENSVPDFEFHCVYLAFRLGVDCEILKVSFVVKDKCGRMIVQVLNHNIVVVNCVFNVHLVSFSFKDCDEQMYFCHNSYLISALDYIHIVAHFWQFVKHFLSIRSEPNHNSHY